MNNPKFITLNYLKKNFERIFNQVIEGKSYLINTNKKDKYLVQIKLKNYSFNKNVKIESLKEYVRSGPKYKIKINKRKIIEEIIDDLN